MNTNCQIATLEKIQRRAARLCVIQNYSRYLLNWKFLEQRKNQAKRIMLYKIWSLLILINTYSNLYPTHESTI